MSTMSLTLAAAAATLLAVPALAAAQPGTQPAAPLQALPEAPAAPASKSGATATGIAVGTTLTGMAVMLAADDLSSDVGDAITLGLVGFGTMLVGPSAGHLYAGEYGHALGLTALRTAAVGVIIVGFAANVEPPCWEDCDEEHARYERQHDDGGTGLAVLGTVALVGLTAYDLWDAHNAAGRTNGRNALRVTPTALATTHGTVGGLALGGSF